ncbi:MAG: dihydroorotase family protein, partial [Oligoflexales bacterium]|nr:dihydroorotase family protein [Oligoflexales bacterium]
SKPEDFIIHSLIRSSKAAMTSTEAILEWAIRYKRPVHIAHISTPQEVAMILKANKLGAHISCEVAPHHLLLDTSYYSKFGSLVKMNPPIRSLEEVQQLNRHFSNGEIDIWATDHAPHTKEEKATTVRKAPSGVPGIELFYPLFFECLARNKIPLEKLFSMANSKPAKLFGFDKLGEIKPGNFADFVFMEAGEYLVDETKLLGKSHWSPYHGFKLKHKVLACFNSGELKYSNLI